MIGRELAAWMLAISKGACAHLVKQDIPEVQAAIAVAQGVLREHWREVLEDALEDLDAALLRIPSQPGMPEVEPVATAQDRDRALQDLVLALLLAFREDLERLFGMLATGAIRPRVAERIAFDEVAGAHRRLEAAGLAGKLVLCPDLDRQDLATRHLVDVMQEVYGVQLVRAVEYVEPVVADGYAARALSVRARTPLFQIERITYAMNDAVAEYRRALLRGDAYRYRIELR